MSNTIDFTTLTPDKSETERFLKMLNPMGMQNYDFRTFDDFILPDGKGRRIRSLNSKYRGTITEVFEALCGHQRGGAGIFLTVNVTDGIQQLPVILVPFILTVRKQRGRPEQRRRVRKKQRKAEMVPSRFVRGVHNSRGADTHAGP